MFYSILARISQQKVKLNNLKTTGRIDNLAQSVWEHTTQHEHKSLGGNSKWMRRESTTREGEKIKSEQLIILRWHSNELSRVYSWATCNSGETRNCSCFYILRIHTNLAAPRSPGISRVCAHREWKPVFFRELYGVRSILCRCEAFEALVIRAS